MIYLDKNQVPAFLRGAYNGNKLQADARTSVTINSDAGLWSGGSRSVYYAIDLESGRQIPLPGQDGAPWDANRKEQTIELKPGFAIVRHAIFCGKDLGLTFYIHPDNVAKLVPDNSGAELCAIEKTVLSIIRAMKAGYRADEYRRRGIANGELEAIKSRLIALGFLNKAGAITVTGRNAVEGFRP